MGEQPKTAARKGKDAVMGRQKRAGMEREHRDRDAAKDGCERGMHGSSQGRLLVKRGLPRVAADDGRLQWNCWDGCFG